MVMVIKENDALLILIKLISLRIIISKIIVIGKYYHVNFDTKIRKKSKCLKCMYGLFDVWNYNAEFEIKRTILICLN